MWSVFFVVNRVAAQSVLAFQVFGIADQNMNIRQEKRPAGEYMLVGIENVINQNLVA